MADSADDSESKQISQIKGKFVSRIKSWQSSRLKYNVYEQEKGWSFVDMNFFDDSILYYKMFISY